MSVLHTRLQEPLRLAKTETAHIKQFSKYLNFTYLRQKFTKATKQKYQRLLRRRPCEGKTMKNR